MDVKNVHCDGTEQFDISKNVFYRRVLSTFLPFERQEDVRLCISIEIGNDFLQEKKR